MQKRSKNDKIVCFQTDKSGKMSVDSKSNYVSGMKSHHENMETTSDTEYASIENVLNAHITAWGHILNMNRRTQRNFVATHNIVPPLYGLRKDHKNFNSAVEGPPLRPVCGAVVGSNMRILYFLSSILRPVIALSEDVSDSTEDMLSRVSKCNESDVSDCIVGSMDVEALYPSIDIDFDVDRCIELLRESGIKFTNVDFDELGLFLVFNDTESNLEQSNLLRYCPKRIPRVGRRPLFTASGINSNETL